MFYCLKEENAEMPQQLTQKQKKMSNYIIHTHSYTLFHKDSKLVLFSAIYHR